MEGIETIKRFGNHTKPYCVLGVLKTEDGVRIELEMLSWLTKSYDVYSVRQDPPGNLFEYPALKFMQDLCEKEHCNCLYLHTKGAANSGDDQRRIRNMWRYELEHYLNRYTSPLNTQNPVVTTQLTGKGKDTWYNMFYANESAMRTVDLSKPSTDRFSYEHIFRNTDTKVIGVYASNVTTEFDRRAFRIALLNERGGDAY